MIVYFFVSSRRRHTRCALVTGVQTCALPILLVRPLAGHGARALLDAGLTLNGDAPEELIARAILVFLEHYADNICTFSAPYPGLELALEELRIEGFRQIGRAHV